MSDKFTPEKTFHVEFDTKEMPGKIVSTKITIERHIESDPNFSYRVDLLNHPLYKWLHAYCRDNPPPGGEAKTK